MPENYSTPTPPDPDGPTAWVRGDLPAEPEAQPAEPTEMIPAVEADGAGEPQPAGSETPPDGQAETLAEVSDLAAVYDGMIEPALEVELDLLVEAPQAAEAEKAAAGQAETLLEVAELAAMYDGVVEPMLEVELVPAVAEPAVLEAVEVVVELPAEDVALEALAAQPELLPAEMPAEPVEMEAPAGDPEAPPAELPAEPATLEMLTPTLVAEPEPPPPMELPVLEPLTTEALIESLLFVADGAIPVSRLAEALEVSTREVEAGLAALAETYRQRGLSLQRFRDKVQLTTAAAAAAAVERFLGLAALTPLSRAALEALAIVAYQQPVTRPQIEAIRGVNSDSVIKNLLSKGLIEKSGRAEGPGRPVLYSTTPEFMQHFGLAALTDLPPLSLPALPSQPTAQDILKG